MVVIITATGFAPIPLGFGFTLTGVGGLVAVDRTVDVGALQAGLRSGSLDAMLFPSDAVKPADRQHAAQRVPAGARPGRVRADGADRVGLADRC